MNLGIYVDSTKENEEMEQVVSSLNEGVTKGHLVDASIFYDTVGHNSLSMKCGCFNSTDLWAFTGNLITTSINNTRTAMNIVNKFKIYFYYRPEPAKDLFGLINVINNPSIKTLCRNEDEAKELYRLTGTAPVGLVDKFNLSEILTHMRTP